MSLREVKKQNTKRVILETAISLFSENGYDNTSIEQIARKAGVGKGTVYSYFDNKKSIIKGFCEYELETIHKQLIAQPNVNATVLEQLLIIYMTEFQQVTRNPEFGRLYMREVLFPAESDIEKNEELDEKYFGLLFPIFKRGQERGELREDIEFLHITAHFYSLFIIIIHAWFSKRITTEEIEPSMELLFKQVLDGLKPASEPHTICENSND